MAGDESAISQQQSDPVVQGICSPIETVLQWPDVSQIPKLRGGKPVNSRRPFLRDTKQYTNLLKQLRKEFPSGEIKMLPKETAKRIALESRLFAKITSETVQHMVTLLSEDVESNFIKINKDIGLIEEGREEEILPFQGVEKFLVRMNLRKVFASLTKPGTVIKSLADYKKDVDGFLKIKIASERLATAFCKELVLGCLAVLYKRTKYTDNINQVFKELEAYRRIHERLSNELILLTEDFRKSRNQLVEEYDFKQIYDESYEPTTYFEKCVLGELDSNAEDAANNNSLWKENSANQNAQSPKTGRNETSFNRGKKRSKDRDGDRDWKPSTKICRKDDFQAKVATTRAQKVGQDDRKPITTGMIPKKEFDEKSSKVFEIVDIQGEEQASPKSSAPPKALIQNKGVKREREVSKFEVIDISFSDDEEEQRPAKMSKNKQAATNQVTEDSVKETPESNAKSLDGDPVPGSKDNCNVNDSLGSNGTGKSIVETRDLNRKGSDSGDKKSKIIDQDKCIVCKKEKAEKPTLYCSDACVFFSVLTGANKDKVTGKFKTESPVSEAVKDLASTKCEVKTTKVMEQPLPLLVVPDSDGSFKLVISKNGQHVPINVAFSLEDSMQK